MLNIGRLAPGGADYYLNTVASGVEGYYPGAGEAPGYWTGDASATLAVLDRHSMKLRRSCGPRPLPAAVRTAAEAERRPH